MKRRHGLAADGGVRLSRGGTYEITSERTELFGSSPVWTLNFIKSSIVIHDPARVSCMNNGTALLIPISYYHVRHVPDGKQPSNGMRLKANRRVR